MADNSTILGDENALAQIINDDYSATNGHFEDSITTRIKERKFSHSSFITAKFPNVTNIETYAFGGFGASPYHRKILFPKATSIHQNALTQGAHSLYFVDMGMVSETHNLANAHAYYLCAIIYRNPNVVTCNSIGDVGNSETYNFVNSDGCGYIYVPRDLISSYQTATNWATIYANKPNVFRALEDYTVDGTTTGDIDESKIFIPKTPFYSLDNRVFNGSEYIDTGIKLFDGNHDILTIIIDFTVTQLQGNERLIHCFDESIYDGFWFGRHVNNNASQSVKYSPPTTGNNGILSFGDDAFTNGVRAKTALIIDNNNNRVQTLHSRIDKTNYNGNAKYNQTFNRTRTSISTLNTTMLIGAGRNSSGNIYGYFNGKINKLRIYNERIDDWQIIEDLDVRLEDTP